MKSSPEPDSSPYFVANQKLVERAVSDAIDKLFAEKPDDPLQFLGRFVLGLSAAPPTHETAPQQRMDTSEAAASAAASGTVPDEAEAKVAVAEARAAEAEERARVAEARAQQGEVSPAAAAEDLSDALARAASAETRAAAAEVRAAEAEARAADVEAKATSTRRLALDAAVDQLVAQARKAQSESKGEDEARARHSKFAETSPFTLAFGHLPDFFEGLEGHVGQPSPSLRVAMEAEHCESEDSHDDLTTGNYGITTKPIIEWYAVVDPAGGLLKLKLDAYPAETQNIDDEGRRGPGLKPLADFEAVLEAKNTALVAKGGEKSRALLEEFIAGRLYTGPMFEKYNLVCRSSIQQAPQFLKDDCKAKCKGNSYTTTIHLLNSLIIKLSKLTKATTVYRGVSCGVLPKCFWEDNEEGVRGGVEAGFMSTTTSRDVAIGYAGGLEGAQPILFEMEQGMIDRGAVIEWLSQYPGEQEVLFAPFTCIELRGSQNEERAIVLRMKLTINLLAPTIEKVIAKLQVSHVDLLHLFELSFNTNGVPAEQLVPLRRLITEAEAKEGSSFNDAEIFQAATAEAFAARDAVLRWMVEGTRLEAPWPKRVAKLGTRVDEAAMAVVVELAEEERVRVGMEVAATEDGLNWKFGSRVTAVESGGVEGGGVEGGAITVKTRFGTELKGLPPAKALVVREGGAGALLREAAAAGKEQMVEVLLGAHVSPFVVADARLNTALHLAAAAGHARVCRALQGKGADPYVCNAQAQSALGLAAANRHAAVRRVFLPTLSDREFTEEACTATAWLRAAAAGDVAALVAMAAASKDEEGEITALMVACSAGQLAAVEVLLPAASVDARSAEGCTALYLAAETGDLGIVRLLVARGAGVALAASDGGTPLMMASGNGDEPCVRALVESGAAVNVQTEDGMTALMIASQDGHELCLRTLVESGAAVNVQREDGMTALMLASRDGHEPCVRALVESGAAVNVQEEDGWTALMWACQNGHEPCLRALVESGAAVDVQTKNGATALMWACENGHEPCTRLLLGSMELPDDNCFISSFGTVALPGAPTLQGKVYYEITLALVGPFPQIGWATSGFAPGNGNGVGDDAASWGADGVRGDLLHSGTEDWPIRWEDGDTIGCAADLELGQLWFGRNGVWSLAFEGCSSKWEAGLYPAITGDGMSFSISSPPRFAGPTAEFKNIGRLPLQLCDEGFTGFLLGDVQRA